MVLRKTTDHNNVTERFGKRTQLTTPLSYSFAGIKILREMATSVSTDAHGVRVVMQIIPLDGPEPVQSQTVIKTCKVEPEMPYMTRMFLKGEPVALGTVQVFTGLLMTILGVIALITKILDGAVPLGLGLSFVLCGSFTLCAHKGNCPALIKSTLALNIVNVVLALSGIGFFSYLLTVKLDLQECASPDTYSYYYYGYDCQNMYWALQTLTIGMKVVLLIFSVLEACVCTTLIVFSSKSFGTRNEDCRINQVQGSTERLMKDEKELDLPPAYQA